MRDNMGMGIRMGPEGEQGYIANGDTGVRITLEGDKEYGVNVGDPQALVDCVRASRAASDARED